MPPDIPVEVLSCTASAPSFTPVFGLAASDVEIPALVVLHIDFTEDQDVIPSCQQNQVGLIMDLQLADSAGSILNLTGATDLHVWLRPPSGNAKRKNGAVRGEPSLGVMRFTTETGDLHEFGMWAIQVSALLASGLRVYSRVERFRVHPNVGPHQITAIAPELVSSMRVIEPTIVFS